MTDNEAKAKILELERRIQALEANQQLQPTASDALSKQQSLREFLNEKKPDTANDRGLCIAFYYEVIKGYESFNAEDIKSGFREARIPAPKNPNDIINKNIAKAYMMDAEQTKDGKKAWVLTATGERVVLSEFPRSINKEKA